MSKFKKYRAFLVFALATLAVTLFWYLLGSFLSGKEEVAANESTLIESVEAQPEREFYIGEAIDSLHGVYVYYNGDVSNNSGRNLTADGYNLGQKYQCVEFVKRYYYDHLNHKMPDSYGHAVSFFDPALRDGQKNSQRMLLQFKNGSMLRPAVSDLIVFNMTDENPYGHVAIVSEVSNQQIEIIQQNPVRTDASREILPLENIKGRWIVQDSLVLGWLRVMK